MRGKWMERKIRAGAVEEKYTFFAPLTAKPRGKRKQKCTPRAQDVNEHMAEKRFARLLNCNFRHNDLMLGLEYDAFHYAELEAQAYGDMDGMRAIAEKDTDSFVRRMKYHLAKAGKMLGVYVCVVSDMDGDTGELVRSHVHLILKAGTIRMEDGRLWAGDKDLEELWGKGSISVDTLHNQSDFTPLAQYLLRQVRRQKDKAKYKISRGMKKPVIVDEEVVTNTRELRAPKGARVQYRRAYEPGKPQYIRYVVPEREKRKRGGKRE